MFFLLPFSQVEVNPMKPLKDERLHSALDGLFADVAEDKDNKDNIIDERTGGDEEARKPRKFRPKENINMVIFFLVRKKFVHM